MRDQHRLSDAEWRARRAAVAAEFEARMVDYLVAAGEPFDSAVEIVRAIIASNGAELRGAVPFRPFPGFTEAELAEVSPGDAAVLREFERRRRAEEPFLARRRRAFLLQRGAARRSSTRRPSSSRRRRRRERVRRPQKARAPDRPDDPDDLPAGATA